MYLRFFLLAVVVYFAVRALNRFMSGLSQGARGQGPFPRARSGDVPVKMAKDPVCGTFVVPGKALSTTAAGETMWFCSEHCRSEFARRR